MRFDLRKSLFILPNLFTLSGIFCGFYAVVLCSLAETEDDLYRACLLIVYAILFDMIDGRVARLTHTQSAFGTQMDSLADVLSFGLAPGLVVYRWSLHSLGSLGIGASFLFVAAGAIRLARFNVMSMRQERHRTKRVPPKYVVGLPIPGAAGILVSLVGANHAVSGHLPGSPIPVLCLVLVLCFLMVSTVRFRSFKDLHLSWGTVLTVIAAMGSSAWLALRFHVAFALVWLLTCYVGIGIAEFVYSLTRRGLQRRELARAAEEEEELTTPS
ncbi:MAG: CDP-diacylglycerol--serine O-phosphatidyltransferase [Proteobacteria bacterium]|nr:CDP-diacylglycerol--serine O-phosphatidyltransferase [Pseudomonadota bacterium]